MASLSTRYKNLQSSVTAVIKAAPGNLYMVAVNNRNGAARYLQLFDRATSLSGGETPDESYLIPEGPVPFVLGYAEFGPTGTQFLTGITFAISTTAITYTAATATDHEVFVRYS